MAQVGLLEDNIRVARLCATLLGYVGHEVIIYDQPVAALQQLLPSDKADKPAEHSHRLPIDLLILDFYLPGMDGLEVIQTLQANPLTCTLPLILCTAASNKDVLRTLDLFPHVGFVEKPFHIQTLTRAITSSLEMKASSKSSV